VSVAKEYRIEYSIQCASEEGDEFEEIGFGSSGAWDDIAAAAHMLSSGIDNEGWETPTEGTPTWDEHRQEGDSS